MIYKWLTAGILLGVVSIGGFNWSLEATSTEQFCLGCHEMQIPKDRLMTTAHGNNKFGVVPGCADCHIPASIGPKLIRKIEAAREVWGHVLGTIDTPEAYEAHREVMRDRELARMTANDSAECRGCHNNNRWASEMQSAPARKKHEEAFLAGKTCIECHSDVAHPLPVDDSDLFGMHMSGSE